MPHGIYGILLSILMIINMSACSPQNDPVNAFKLDHVVHDKAISILRQGINDKDFWPSLHAAEALTEAGLADEVKERLQIRLIGENDDSRRAGIARELVRAGDISKVEILAAILRKNDPSSRIGAAEGLYKISEIGDQNAMDRAFNSKDDVILHLMAAGALVKAGNKEALQAIRRTYATGDSDAIRIGSWLLGRLGNEDDIQLLRSRLKDTVDENIISYIHHSMAALGDPSALEILALNLSSPDASIRSYAAIFAQEANALSLAPRLIKMLDDPHLDARYRAAKTLLFFEAK